MAQRTRRIDARRYQTPVTRSLPALQGKKALVTGASGFIGGRLRDALLEQGVDVVAVRRPGSPASKRGRSVEATYEDLPGLTRVLESEKPDLLFHVAGTTKGVTERDFRDANVKPTENLLAAARTGHPGLSRFVLMSSLTAYGPSSKERPHEETHNARPIELYGHSKLESELVTTRQPEIPWTILRPGGVYGPGDVDYFQLFKEAASGRNVFFGNRARWWSAIYVDDLVDATLRASVHPAAIRQGYFACDGVPLTWQRFQDLIKASAGRRVFDVDLPEFLVDVAAVGGELVTRIDKKPRLFNRQKAAMGKQEAWTCRSDKLRRDLGWASEVAVERGVPMTFDWYRRERWI
jgi:nucleoside-diphosphate-sugar epimerase